MKITLTAWAERHYDPAPSAWTLAQWRRTGQIHPAPERVDRQWYVEETASRLVDDHPRPSLVRRVREAA